MAFWGRFFGGAGSTAAGVAIGATAVPALQPAIELIVQEAWLNYPNKAVAAGVLAEGVAQGQVDHDWAEQEAARTGVNADRFRRLIDIANVGPGSAFAFELWRRGIIDEAGFRRAVKRLGLEQEWINDLAELRSVLLDPAELANARQQGFIDEARQHEEAAKQGITNERADIQFELSGLPPGIETGLEMWRRDFIDEPTFARIVREGHTKTKYTAALERLKRVLLNPGTLVNLRLRGWIDDGEFHNRMEPHGYDAAEADDWYHATGRPITLHQAMLGLRRGGVYEAPLSDTPQPFRDAVIRSDIRPEWANLLYMGRETYPSAFVVRRLVDTGAFTAAEGADLLYKAGWNRELADKAAAAFGAGTSTTSKGLTATDLANEYEARWLTKPQYVAGLKEIGYSQSSAEAKAEAEDSRRARLARNRRVELIGQRYVKHGIGRDRALAELQAAEVPARVRDTLMPEWDAMRELTPDALTSAQIKKAFRSGLLTRAETIARLEAKGYDAPDAAILLDE